MAIRLNAKETIVKRVIVMAVSVLLAACAPPAPTPEGAAGSAAAAAAPTPAASDSTGIAEALAAELGSDEGPIVVEAEGLGARVAAAIGQETVEQGPPPPCPSDEPRQPGAALAVNVRVMELTNTTAIVHVTTGCHRPLSRGGGFMRLVRFELRKEAGHWVVADSRLLMIT